MNRYDSSSQSMSSAELSWFGAVIVLSCIAIFGSINADPFRVFAPKSTVLYVSAQEHGVRTARAYLPDGSLVDLSNGTGVTVRNIGNIPDIHIDPWPQPTPWQNLRIRFSSVYAVSHIDLHPELLFGGRLQGRTVIRGRVTEAEGIEIRHLPGSLLLWSTAREPIAIMDAIQREETALGEGRYGNPDTPAVLLVTRVPHADDFLKLLTAFETPSLVPLKLGDGTTAREIIANTEAISVQPLSHAVGELRVADQVKSVPGLLALGDVSPWGIPALLFSDSAALQEDHSLSLDACPIVTLRSFLSAPFFAIGTDQDGRFVFCSE